MTLEQGTYGVGPGLDDAELVADVFRRIEPLASSRLVIANDFVADLPEALRDGDAVTAPDAARRAARSTRSTCCPHRSRSKRSCRRAISGRCKLLYGIGGLSYGNVERALHRRRRRGRARRRRGPCSG